MKGKRVGVVPRPPLPKLSQIGYGAYHAHQGSGEFGTWGEKYFGTAQSMWK